MEFFEARIQDLQRAGQVRAGEEVHPAAERLLHGARGDHPTMKLRRKIIEAKYQREIEAMYSHV
jgi:long-chain acyl-CoA synthetase